MSNYNSTLQSHNAELQSLLESINDLPQAGVDIEMCSLSITNNTGYETTLYFTDHDGVHTLQLSSQSSFSVIKNSIVVMNIISEGKSMIVSCNDAILRGLSEGYIFSTSYHTFSFVAEDSMNINITAGGEDEPT